LAIVFWVLAGVIVSGAIGVVAFRNIMHSALSLGVTLLGVAGVFLLLGGDFLAAVQVTVYVSGILVLMLFVVMLTQRLYDRSLAQTNEQVLPAAILCLLILVPLLCVFLRTDFDRILVKPQTTVAMLGRLLLTDYVVPFEVASVLLLAAMVGAILLTRRTPGESRKP
jgi:NADH:ubiquinone oxidoreductase subunit 6 (subunit J)